MISPRTRILLNLFTPQRRKPNPTYAIADSDKNLSGKTIVFTGGTDGIGRVAVGMLYNMGANIVLLGRNKTKAEAVVQELLESGGSGKVTLQICDLASMNSVKDCAERILDENSQIDILINNAGVNLTQRKFTDDGFEANWAINHLGPYLFTTLLLERIKKSSPSRIVNLSTNTAFIEKMDLNKIQDTPDFGTSDSYVESKLSQNMFSIELARKLEGTGVTVNYLCPGYIKSNLLSDLKGAEKIMQFIMQIMASPTVVGAERIVRLAVSSEFKGVTGQYLNEDKIESHHAEAQVTEKREQLLNISSNALAKWL